MLRNPNIRILLIAAALVLAVASLGVYSASIRKLPEGTEYPIATAEPDTTAQPVAGPTAGPESTVKADAEPTADPAAQPETTHQPPKGYLMVQVRDKLWPLLPLVEGGEYVVEQEDGSKNVIHTTATGAVMHSSTCDNQSCVMQGVASLENRDTRILGGMIICLPNQVLLEVLAPEDLGMQEEAK